MNQTTPADAQRKKPHPSPPHLPIKFPQTSNDHLSKTNLANSVEPTQHMLNNFVLSINILTVTYMPQNTPHNNANDDLKA